MRYIITTAILIVIIASSHTDTAMAATWDWPHNSVRFIDCSTCHLVHKHLGPSLTNADTINNGCKSCHYPLGDAEHLVVKTHIDPADEDPDPEFISCGVCHNPHTQEQGNTPFCKLIRAQVQTPNSGEKDVIFTGTEVFPENYIDEYPPLDSYPGFTDPPCFIAGDAPYDGICEVCHTQTDHHRNDGNAPDLNPDHPDDNAIACVSCHPHELGFMAMGGGAHYIHVAAESGPKMTTCNSVDGYGCHGMDDPYPPNEPDIDAIANSDACDYCHTAPSDLTLAKQYWDSPGSSAGIADTWLDDMGEKNFCGSCHDETPGNTLMGGGGPYADNVLGDDLSYGFYETGHGVSSGNHYETLPFQLSSESGNPAANKVCSDCHSLTSRHFGSGRGRLRSGFENDDDNSNCTQCHAPGTDAVADPHDYITYADYQDTPHRDTKCSECHEAHGLVNNGADSTFAGMTRTDPEAEDGCTTECHNDGITSHKSQACTICHNPHAPEQKISHVDDAYAETGRLVRTEIKISDTATADVEFTNSNLFASETGPYKGICQVCHTTTAHHRKDDSGGDHSHYLGEVCTDCHPHNDYFRPNNCTDCHSQPQGSRRQIVGAGGDFEMTSHHVSGTVASPATVEDSDCSVCHDMSNHKSGTVKLKDPDTGATIVYNPGNPAGIEGFCINCHDGDGAVAGGGVKPFSDEVAPPDIAFGDWSDSAHNAIGYPQNGGNPITCFGDGLTNGCHSNGHGSPNIKLLAAPNGIAIDQFCYNCHTEGKVMNDALSGAGLADDIQQAFSQSRKHDLGTTFTVNSNTYTLQCTTCHNPHVVTGKHWDVSNGVSPITRPDLSTDPATNPRAMGTTLWGAAPDEKMDDYAAGAPGTGGWYYSVARGSTMVFDQSAVYQPPKVDTGYNFEFSGDVLPDYPTFCLTCHSSTMGSHNPINWGEAHGRASANKPSYISDEGTAGFWGNSGNPDVIFGMNYVTRGRHNGHFMRWPYDSAERSAGINFVMSCTDCHESHGATVRSMLRTTVNNGPGTTIWNTMCNNCHYYYGGHHAGMSCGNASCHRQDSIHGMDRAGGGGGTQLMLTAAGYEGNYQRPDFTPEITSVEGTVGSNQLTVTFADGVWAEMDLIGDLLPDDFWLFDSNDNQQLGFGVTHTAGDATATIALSQALTAESSYTLAARPASVWKWYEGGYVNAATGIIAAQAVSAGPWPVTLSVCPTDVVFNFDEPAGSTTATDETGLLVGTVGVADGGTGNPNLALPGDGYFHSSESLKTYIEFADDQACLNSPRAVTVEARVRPTEVDRGVGDNTFNRIFERRRTMLVTIMNTDYGGDDVPERYGKARVQIKYRVEDIVGPGARHDCPDSQWPEDPYEGPDVRMHQINSDIDRWPIVDNHWYQIKVVFNSDKGPNYGTPVDIFIDDQGTDGQDSDEQWPGYVNATATINESSSCQWGSLPGDVINDRADSFHIGANWNSTVHFFAGQIDWVTWSPVSDYSGVDDVPNFGDYPTNAAANPGDGSVQISWDAMPGASSYNIYWATSPGVTRLALTNVSGATSPETIIGLTNGIPYYFIVTAVYPEGESGPSYEVSATPAP
ncbi:hypothetical protein ACFL6S_06370 [Candidatus Poribacteria bacterium]